MNFPVFRHCKDCYLLMMFEKKPVRQFCPLCLDRRKLETRARRKQRLDRGRHKQTCYWCARGFKGSPAARWCSQHCKGAYYSMLEGRKRILMRRCGDCGCKLQLKSRSKCDDCTKTNRPYERPTSECDQCSIPFEKSRPQAKFCSDPCRRKAYGNKGSNLRGYVLDRDGWKCQLPECMARSRRIPFDSAVSGVYDPLRGEADHIIPWSQGGSNEPVNLQASHKMCNAAKGVKAVGSQMMLVG